MGLPLAMAVLALVLSLAAWSATAADDLHRSSEQSRSAKRALGPADAGVQHARWRLSQAPAPTAAQCVLSDAGPAAPAAGGACPAPTGTSDLGNGAAFRYVISPVLAAGATCAGVAVAAGTTARCVTSVGSAGGVERRVQTALVSEPPAAGGFVPPGLVGLTRVTVNNGIEMARCPDDPQGVMGSNGQIEAINGVKLRDAPCGTGLEWRVEIGPDAPAPDWNGKAEPSNPTTIRRTTAWALPAIDPWPAANDNARIPTGSGITWNATTREMVVTNADLNLQGGTYVFCDLRLGNGADLRLTASATVRIYIDSPSRPGSTCRAGKGMFRAENSNGINFPDGKSVKDVEVASYANRLRMYVWGNPALETASLLHCPTSSGPSSGSIVLCNSVWFAGTIHAPTARAYLGNSIDYVGSLAADDAYLFDSVKFRFPPGLEAEPFGGGGSPRTVTSTWTECSSASPGATGCT